MTHFPKEFILNKRSSLTPASESFSQKPIDNDRFKQYMQKDDCEERDADTDESEQKERISPEGLFSAACVKIAPAEIAPAASASAILSKEITSLFEEMAGTMLILATSHEKEMTLFLDGPKFAHSLFAGTRITIKEFSTAPRAFNIEIAAQAAARNILAAQQGALLAAFERGKFPFTVHRLDTELHTFDREEQRDKEDDTT